MGDISENFNRSEFACKGKNCCGHAAPVSPALVTALQALRDSIGVGITINSGFRCNTHNRSVGGSPSSFHVLGMAADIVADGLTAEQVAAAAEQVAAFRAGGIGEYDAWVHVDVRTTGPARWAG